MGRNLPDVVGTRRFRVQKGTRGEGEKGKSAADEESGKKKRKKKKKGAKGKILIIHD